MKIHTVTINDFPLRVDTDLLKAQLNALMSIKTPLPEDAKLLEGLETFLSEMLMHMTLKDAENE